MHSDTSLLADLNPPQREAVTVPGGPLLVLAGAGSGKTRVLTRRMSWLIEQRLAHPGEILAVTFTNKAAREMRERVAGLLNGTSVMGLWVGTFHAMGSRILRQNAALLGYDGHFTILDAADQERLVKSLVEEHRITMRGWPPRQLPRHLLNAISRLKDDGIEPDQIQPEQLGMNTLAISQFYTLYQDALRHNNAMDFGDLLLNCLILWQRHPQTLDQYSQRFRHILVDEYQDTNLVQSKWLKKLNGKHGNLTVVGDDDQSIYGWRGACLDNILDFEKNHPKARVVRLEQNYRSTGNILAAAEGLIAHNRGRLGKTLWSSGPPGPPVVRYMAEDGEEEARYVSRRVGEQLAQAPQSTVAVFVRAGHQTRLFEEAFIAQGIRYRVYGGFRFMDRLEVRDAVAYLSLVGSERNGIAFARVVNVPPRGLGKGSVDNITAQAQRTGRSLMETAREMVEQGALRGAANRRLGAFLDLIDSGRRMMIEGETLPDILEYLLNASGYYEHLQGGDDTQERMENLRELKLLLHGHGDLTSFLEYASLNSSTDDQEEQGQPIQLSLSTLHASKGLEFDAVFLTGLEEYLLPHKLAVETSGQEGVEEERRLTYVGMTRARKYLTLTYARRRNIFGHYEYALPSRFLREIPQDGLREDGASNLSVRRGVGGRAERGNRMDGTDWMAQAAAASARVAREQPASATPAGGKDTDWMAQAAAVSAQVTQDRDMEGKDTDWMAQAAAASTRVVREQPASARPAGGKETDWMAQAAAVSTQVTQDRDIRPPLPVVTSDAQEFPRFPPRTKVRHEHFGEGIVRGYEGTGDQTRVLVYFWGKGSKKLVLRFAGLTAL